MLFQAAFSALYLNYSLLLESCQDEVRVAQSVPVKSLSHREGSTVEMVNRMIEFHIVKNEVIKNLNK